MAKSHLYPFDWKVQANSVLVVLPIAERGPQWEKKGMLTKNLVKTNRWKLEIPRKHA